MFTLETVQSFRYPRIQSLNAKVTSALSSNCWANPSSGYASGRAARERVEECRKSVESMLGIKGGGGNIIFTSGGTEVGSKSFLGSLGRLAPAVQPFITIPLQFNM